MLFHKESHADPILRRQTTIMVIFFLIGLIAYFKYLYNPHKKKPRFSLVQIFQMKTRPGSDIDNPSTDHKAPLETYSHKTKQDIGLGELERLLAQYEVCNIVNSKVETH